MNIQHDVRQFKLATKRALPDHPTIIPLEARILHAKLIIEEAFEQVEAMGVQVSHKCNTLSGDFEYREGEAVNLTKVADGCVDQIYVTVGAAAEFGINLKPIWNLVQTANMAKFGPGSYQRPDGKQMKPPGWIAPDASITEELKRQCLQGNSLCSE